MPIDLIRMGWIAVDLGDIARLRSAAMPDSFCINRRNAAVMQERYARRYVDGG
jgi:hypothetical protein